MEKLVFFNRTEMKMKTKNTQKQKNYENNREI